MVIGVVKETSPETRVSLSPEVCQALTKLGVTVWVAHGAGHHSYFSDSAYVAAGAHLMDESALSDADILLSIHPKGIPEKLKQNAIVMGVYQPLFNVSLMQQWAERGITVFSLDTLPRTTRAQSMDVLSSQANIAGYKAVLLG